jgi:hypothetical protein
VPAGLREQPTKLRASRHYDERVITIEQTDDGGKTWSPLGSLGMEFQIGREGTVAPCPGPAAAAFQVP